MTSFVLERHPRYIEDKHTGLDSEVYAVFYCDPFYNPTEKPISDTHLEETNDGLIRLLGYITEFDQGVDIVALLNGTPIRDDGDPEEMDEEDPYYPAGRREEDSLIYETDDPDRDWLPDDEYWDEEDGYNRRNPVL